LSGALTDSSERRETSETFSGVKEMMATILKTAVAALVAGAAMFTAVAPVSAQDADGRKSVNPGESRRAPGGRNGGRDIGRDDDRRITRDDRNDWNRDRRWGWNTYPRYSSYGWRRYDTPWWVDAPLTVGTLPFRVITQPFGVRRYGVSSRHVNWCENRYRSYNPGTNTWLSYSGNYRQCISPYS
jgi:BA14K-like protein